MIRPNPERASPATSISRAELAAERDRMLADPRPLARPLLVLGGWRTSRVFASIAARDIVTPVIGTREAERPRGPNGVLPIGFVDLARTDDMIARVLSMAADAFPSPAGRGAVEVDVVGVSMGGVLARAAAAPSATRRFGSRLRISRLFTLASPHRGARLARLIAADSAARDLKPGSAFLARLDEALPCRDYELVCYARLGDWWVGARNTAPPEPDPASVPIWVPAPVFGSHVLIVRDLRLRLDIARRLRDEEPLLTPGVPPPTD